MTRYFKKLIPQYAILPLLLTLPSLLISYQGAKLVQALFGMPYVFDLTLPVDRWISFSPPWVLAYLASYAFWVYVYVVGTKESPLTAWRLLVADWIGKLVSLCFFLLLPTTNVRPEITGQGICDKLMALVFTMDTPTNLFPSAHCLIAWIGTRFIFRNKELPNGRFHRSFSAVGTLLVFLSTVYTKQHVVADLLGAIAVSEIAIFVSHHSKLPEKLQGLFAKSET